MLGDILHMKCEKFLSILIAFFSLGYFYITYQCYKVSDRDGVSEVQ